MDDHNLLRYMLTAARISLAQHWKREILPLVQDQETIIKEYETLEKVTVYIHSRIQEWFSYIQHIKQSKLRHLNYGF